MAVKKGRQVCPRCGQTGSVTLEDGSEAVFERHAPSGGAWRLPAALAVLIMAGAAAAAWWWRGDLLDLLPGARPTVAAAAPEMPDWRLAGRDAFAEPLRDGLIGIFGTSGADRPEAFAVLGSGELVTFLGPAGAGAGEAVIVRMDGTADIGTTPVALPAGFVGASLAPGPALRFYLAVTEPTGVRLLAYEDGAAPVWTRELPRSVPPLRRADVAAAGGIVYLAGPAETAGRIGISAFAEEGAQLWQRSFEAPEDARAFASLRAEGGLFVAFETAVSGEGAEVLALWFSEGGETLGALSGVRIEGRLSGARTHAGSAVLLVEGETVSVRSFTGSGEPTWQAALPEAALHDALWLETLARGELAAISAFRLSDIQTDFNVTRFTPDGAVIATQRMRLPPGVDVAAVSVTEPGSLLLSASLGEGEAADAFLLAVDLAAAAMPEEDQESQPTERPALPLSSVAKSGPSSPAAPAAGGPATLKANGTSASPEPPPGRVCRFTCQEGETLFPMSRTLGAAEVEAAGGLEALHLEACRALGALPADGALPECAP